MRTIHLSSVIPSKVSPRINQEICSYFKENFGTSVSLTPFTLTKIPNHILTVSGDASNVSTTYRKLFNYTCQGQFIDLADRNLRKYYVRGLEKIFKPMFFVPTEFRDLLKLDKQSKINNFKKNYKHCSILRFEEKYQNWPYELWRFDSTDVQEFLNFSLLNAVRNLQVFSENNVLENKAGLVLLKDSELTNNVKFKISKNHLDKLQSQPVRYSILLHNYLCQIDVDYQLYDDMEDSNEPIDLLNITGPPEMVTRLEKLLSQIVYDYSK